MLVRINDRGPATPHRLIEVTRRTATLLRFPRDAAVRVRLEVLPAESHAAVDAVPGAPKLDIAAAPRRRGAAERSAAARQCGSRAAPARGPAAAGRTHPPVAAQVARLPETLTQGAPAPGNLFMRLGTFQSYEYANIQRARVGGLGANIVSTRERRGRRRIA